MYMLCRHHSIPISSTVPESMCITFCSGMATWSMGSSIPSQDYWFGQLGTIVQSRHNQSLKQGQLVSRGVIKAQDSFCRLLTTFDCLAASNWPPGHPRSDHHVSNPHHPDYY